MRINSGSAKAEWQLYSSHVCAGSLRLPTNRAVLTLTLVFCCPALLRCSDDRRAGPSVRLVDSLVLREPDSIDFQSQRTHAFTSTGDVIAETGTTIRQFDARGLLLRSMGRAGNGPGEFNQISTVIVLPGDSLVAAVDARRLRIAVFGLDDAKLRKEIVMKPRFFPGQQRLVVGDTIIMSAKLSAQPFASWTPTTDSMLKWGPIPQMLFQSTGAYSRGGEPALAPHDSGWVAVLPGENDLYVLRRNGAPIGVVPLHAERRVGVPKDLVALDSKMWEASPARFPASMVLGIHRLPNGQYVLMHLDTDMDMSKYDPGTGRGWSYKNIRYWASLVSSDLKAMCVDGAIPIDAEDVMLPVFRDSTFNLLSRGVRDGTVHTALYSYIVSDQGCTWIPTGAILPPPEQIEPKQSSPNQPPRKK